MIANFSPMGECGYRITAPHARWHPMRQSIGRNDYGPGALLPVVGVLAVFAQVVFVQQFALHAVDARRQLA